MGSAVFSGDKMVGELNGIETEIYNILTGSFIYNYNTFYSIEYPKEPMVMMVRQYKPPTISVKINKGKPEIYVKVNMEGSVVSVAGNYLLEENLYKVVPKENWSKAHHWMIYHGRRVCHSQKPACDTCTLSHLCDFAKKH